MNDPIARLQTVVVLILGAVVLGWILVSFIGAVRQTIELEIKRSRLGPPEHRPFHLRKPRGKSKRKR